MVIKWQLQDYLNANSLYDSSQSANTKLRSAKTVLLHLHDCLIRAVAKRQIICLCLLDLSAAFDTIDHTIVPDRLSSWFGICETALSWLKSHLASRMCAIKIEDCVSESISLPYGVPRGSVLGPLLFILYTTPLSALNESFINATSFVRWWYTAVYLVSAKRIHRKNSYRSISLQLAFRLDGSKFSIIKCMKDRIHINRKPIATG